MDRSELNITELKTCMNNKQISLHKYSTQCSCLVACCCVIKQKHRIYVSVPVKQNHQNKGVMNKVMRYQVSPEQLTFSLKISVLPWFIFVISTHHLQHLNVSDTFNYFYRWTK